MSGWEYRQYDRVGLIVLAGDWLTLAREPQALELRARRNQAAIERVGFDVSRLGRWDTTLVAFLCEVRGAARAAAVTFDDSALPRAARKLLALLPVDPGQEQVPAPERLRFLTWLGGETILLLSDVGASAGVMTGVLGSLLRLLLGRARLRRADLLGDLLAAGPRAIAIVGVANFLVGAILAFVGAQGLHRFGAESYVPSLVGVASVRELSSLITGIVMAGRSGGAYAARIASMRGNDEIAALRVIGIPIEDFLLLPAVMSLCISMPLLYVFGCVFAIGGGFTVATLSLGLSGPAYLRQTLDAVPLSDFIFGAVKSVAFAALIGAASCGMGLKAARSAMAVGEAATSAVVMNIIGIIALDAIFAVIIQTLGL
jgi:phospholipid/cholesterol/gamma-HCH transport system permease protein